MVDEMSEIGFVQGVVYALGMLASDLDQPTMAKNIWDESGLNPNAVKDAAEYDVAKLRKAVPNLPNGEA